MEKYKQIIEKLQKGHYAQDPHGAAEDLTVIAGEFAWTCSQLEDILSRKPARWNLLRNDFKSDTACERAWESTEDGVNEVGLRLRIKSMEKIMSALRTLIRLATTQAISQ
jgi:hypothetical protein